MTTAGCGNGFIAGSGRCIELHGDIRALAGWSPVRALGLSRANQTQQGHCACADDGLNSGAN